VRVFVWLWEGADVPVDEEETEGDETTDETGGHLTLAGLEAKIDSLAGMVADLVRGRAGGSHGGESEDVAAQVRGEIEKIRTAEGHDRATDGKLGQLTAAVKKLAEKPPKEYRRVTKIMWGEDE
jgi:hypothetical protein